MQVHGLSSIGSQLTSGGYFVKLLANDQAAIFFPTTTEHRNVEQFGLSYEDDSKGNALAATMVPGRIDFRHHRGFSDERVIKIASDLLRCDEMAFARSFRVTYQGRILLRSG